MFLVVAVSAFSLFALGGGLKQIYAYNFGDAGHPSALAMFEIASVEPASGEYK